VTEATFLTKRQGAERVTPFLPFSDIRRAAGNGVST
jgi:hypothetical protein